MEEMLMKHGYISQNENEWTKGDWTVRIDKDAVEIFNDPDKDTGKYYIGPHHRPSFEEMLQEIDSYLIEQALKEPEILNQVNSAPTYNYKKLTVKQVEEALVKLQKEYELKKPPYNFSVFGSEEVVIKWMKEFDKVMLDYLKEFEDEK